MAARILRITGRVQGVGYREAMRREAAGRGLTGWVRNRRDGSVEALVQGDAHAIAALAAWARVGPAAARVEEVAECAAEAEADRPHSGFEIRATL